VSRSESKTDYIFSVRGNGTYQLIYRAGDQVSVLIDWTKSPAVKTDPGAEQQLRVLTTEGLIRCFVNGRYVGGHRATGSVAGGISLYAGGVVHARFDRFVIEERPQTPPGTPTPGKVIVSDDMVSRRSFQVGGGGICRASYDGEGYVVENVAARGLCDLPLISLGAFGSQVRIEGEVKLRSGSFNRSFGIFYGRPLGDLNPMYAGLIDGQGTFQIARRQGQWQRLTRLLIHDSVRKGRDVWNRLAIEVRDQTMRGYVNGELVGEAEGSGLIEGGIGLYVDEPGMAVVYRNLTVTEL
jgi:hypothetical protein